MTITGRCCQSCSWAEIGAASAPLDAPCPLHHTQSTTRARPDGPHAPMKAPLMIYHSGDAGLVCEALREQGLRFQWNGDARMSIEVLPDAMVEAIAA